MLNVQAAVVAYNRKELLCEALEGVTTQTRRLDAVHVVDNASTDGTSEMVAARFPSVSLHTLPTNTGGAGGFAAGLALALDAGADLVWLMDDDTVPTANALEELVAAYEGYRGQRPVAMASKVVWTDGRDHPMNTPRSRPGASRAERKDAMIVGCVPVRSASFVSLLVSADAVRSVGLPEADFFLWNDDFEFSTRLLRNGVGLYCPASVVEHRTKTFGSTVVDPGERFYYEVRNKIWTFTRSTGLAPKEKALYGGSTLRRWARTFSASENRGVLLSGLGRGLIDGVRRGPRDVHEVMDSAGAPIPTVEPSRRAPP
ncbi:MAG: glycosyltransferase [Actinomycetia bacterium]|nr:glycosyltransferase [Actinomycetes bacterium]